MANPGDYLVVEDRAKPSTWHLQVKRNGTPDHGLMGAAWAALHGGYRGNPYQGPNKATALAKLRALYRAEQMDLPAEKALSSFAVYKDQAGRERWVMVSSNAFRDRDGEIVSQKALAADVARADQDRQYGPLRWWHVGQPFGAGLDIGDCDYNAMAGRMLIESGTFRSPAIGAAVARKAAALQGSIGFVHPPNEPDADGVFTHIRRFERSLVPRGKAANPFTSLLVKETSAMDETKVKALAELLGIPPADVQGMVVAPAQQAETKALAAGVAFKAADGEITAEQLVAVLKSNPDLLESALKAMEGMEGSADGEAKADGADAGDIPDMGAEPDGDEDMLTAAECERIATATAQKVIEQLMPHLNIGSKMDEVKSLLGGMSGGYAKKDAADANRDQQIAALQAQIKELQGDAPRAIRAGFKASEANSTIVPEGDARLQQQPTADPINDFLNGFLFSGGQPAAQS